MARVTKQDLDKAKLYLTHQLMEIKKLGEDANTGNKQLVTDVKAKFDAAAKQAEKLYELAESTHHFQATVEFANALNESMANVLEAIKAGQRGDTFGVATHSLTSVSTLLKGLGSVVLLAGPEAIVIAIPMYVLGALIDAVAQLVAFFAPEEESLLEKIDELLRKHQGERELAHMKASFVAIIRLQEAFDEHGGVWESRSWSAYAEEMTKALAHASDHLEVTASWLSNRENQTLLEDWVQVLEAYMECQIYLHLVITQAFFKAYNRALNRLTTLGGKKLDKLVAEQITAIQWCKSQYKPLAATLDRLAWPARNAARLFCIGDNNKVYHTTGCILEKRESGWSSWGGRHTQLEPLSIGDNPAVMAWYDDGGNLEINAGHDWKSVTSKSLTGQFRSLDVTALGDARFVFTTCRDRDGGKVEVACYLVDYDIDANDGTMHMKPQLIDRSNVLQRPHLPIGAVRGFVSRMPGAEPLVQIALLGEKNQVFATRTGLSEQNLHAIGKPLTWCQKIFARDSKVWAIGSHEVAWLPYDAEPTAEWNRLFPDPAKLQLTGNWDFIDLDPPGEDGVLVGTLVHQLLFWTEETGWLKGREDESAATFKTVRRDAHPACLQLIQLRADIAQRLDDLNHTLVFPLTELQPAIKPSL